MSTPPLTTVIVTYRSERTLPRAIAAARRCHEAGVCRTVFVDNASPDGTWALLERERSWAKVVHSGGNVGFGRGCNRGLAEVDTPLTMFLNPDATLEPADAAALVGFMERTPGAGVCGPALIEGDGSYQVSGARPTPWSVLRRHWSGGVGLHPVVPGSKPARSGWVCGAALVIRTELARGLGGFDPRFFLYFEETDLCLRAEAAGWGIWTVGEAVAHHTAGASSEDDGTRVGGCIARHFYQSRFYYFRKHHGLAAAVSADLLEYALLVGRAAWDVARGRGLARLRPRLQSAPLRAPAVVGP